MKKLNSLFAAGVLLFITLGMFSCSQDDDFLSTDSNQTENSSQVYKTRAEVNTVLVKYLELKTDTYVLNISQKEAEKLGISESWYNGALKEIQATNNIIRKVEQTPNSELQLTDPQKALKEAIPWSNSTRSSMPSGTLSTNGQEFAESGLWAPTGMKGVKFVCRTNAALVPVYTCKTKSLNNWRAKTATGTLASNTAVYVPIVASNTSIGVYFSTTDSNGGSAYYVGYN